MHFQKLEVNCFAHRSAASVSLSWWVEKGIQGSRVCRRIVQPRLRTRTTRTRVHHYSRPQRSPFPRGEVRSAALERSSPPTRLPAPALFPFPSPSVPVVRASRHSSPYPTTLAR